MFSETVPKAVRHTHNVGIRLGCLYPDAAILIPPDRTETYDPAVTIGVF
jgi:hypothetical protein